MREFINIITESTTENKNGATFKGKAFWSGSVDLRDGEIREVHSYKEAMGAGFHHSCYFSPRAVDAMDDGEEGFFWIDNGGILTDWRNGPASNAIVSRIKEQIKFL
jgi:hypothetical protein